MRQPARLGLDLPAKVAKMAREIDEKFKRHVWERPARAGSAPRQLQDHEDPVQDVGNRTWDQSSIPSFALLPGANAIGSQYRQTHPRASMTMNIAAFAGICRLKSTAE